MVILKPDVSELKDLTDVDDSLTPSDEDVLEYDSTDTQFEGVSIDAKIAASAPVVLNTTHRTSDGKDHSDVVLNNTHRSSDGKNHSDVVLNNTHRTSDGKDHSDVVANNAKISYTDAAVVVLNTTHRTSDGKDHSDVVLNNTHRASDGKNHSDVVLNNTHRGSDGKNHSDVVLNNAARHSAVTVSDSSNINLGLTGQDVTADLISTTVTPGSYVFTSLTVDANGRITAASSGSASTSPLTTKGDVYTYSTVDARLPVGVNGQIIEADSTTVTGLKWVNPSSGFSDPTTTRGDIIFRDATTTTTRLPIGTVNQVLKSDGTDLSYSSLAAADISDFDVEVANNSAVALNTAKITNVSTDLSEGTSTITTVDVNSSDGTNATLVSASTLRAGLLTAAKFDEVVANNAKATNVSTDLSEGTNTITTVDVNSSDGTNATLLAASTLRAGLLTKAKFDEIVANTAKVSYTDATAVGLNTTHRTSDGKDHSDVVLNNTHRASDGKNHSDVVLNNTHRTSDGKNHSDVVLNNTHRSSDGSDHTYINQDVTTTGTPTFEKETITNTTTSSALYIDQNGNTGSGWSDSAAALYVDNTGNDNGSSQQGVGLKVYSNSAYTVDGLVAIENHNASAQNVLLKIIDYADGKCLDVTRMKASTYTPLVRFLNNSSTGTDNQEILWLQNNNTGSTGDILSIYNTGLGSAVYLDQNGNGEAIDIDSEATSKPLIALAPINGNSRGDIAFGAARTGDPSSPSEGDLWYNSTDNKLKFYDGTANQSLPGANYTREATAGESLVSGNLCYLKSDGKYWKADASVASTSSTELLMCIDTISADGTGSFIETGKFTTTGLTAGSLYYVSETGGAITSTAPTTSTSIVRIIGTALSTTVLKFNPDYTYIEVA